MSKCHEQEYLLHNWSDRRYRDRPQSPRVVLGARPGGCDCSGGNDQRKTGFSAFVE
jgi:hypothetical protein